METLGSFRQVQTSAYKEKTRCSPEASIILTSYEFAKLLQPAL